VRYEHDHADYHPRALHPGDLGAGVCLEDDAMTHTLTAEQERVLRRGGLCLADMLTGPCCLSSWETRGIAGVTFCNDTEQGCSYQTIGCKRAAMESPRLLDEFIEWLAAQERPVAVEMPRRAKVAA